MDEFDERERDTLRERPWIVLATTFDVESWIDNLNRDLQLAIGKQAVHAPGVCFRLAEGGDIFLHTTGDGEVLLDVTPEADWVTPLLSAATGRDAPGTALWVLPGHVLTQMVLGLSPLIAATRLVLHHEFRPKKAKFTLTAWQTTP